MLYLVALRPMIELKRLLKPPIIFLIFLIFFQTCFVFGEENPMEIKNDETWSVHYQTTVVFQEHPSFSAPYSGINSFSSNSESAISWTSTLFLGGRIWEKGELYITPELLAGNGLSSTLGIAGFPNGEIYRVDDPAPKINLSRVYIRQFFERVGSAGAERRLAIIAGKFSLTDFFDNNTYSHDPRTQFLNWSIMYNGAWDYPADTRGYTWGIVIELQQTAWALRIGTAMVPKEANKMELDTHLSKARGDNIELEYRYAINDHDGKTGLFGYVNHAQMGNYRETLNHPLYGMDITLNRHYDIKYGFGVNLQQEISRTCGLSARLGWNDGATETWAFTEIDRTASLMMILKGTYWNRPVDTVGVGISVNGLSNDHADYLSAGGYGFIIGDGRLNYVPEEILETYYLWKPIYRIGVTADFQTVNHPAYNADRGPVYIFGARFHDEF